MRISLPPPVLPRFLPTPVLIVGMVLPLYQAPKTTEFVQVISYALPGTNVAHGDMPGLRAVRY
eukprot:1206065-Rhodomonas_salina.1